MRPKFQLLLTAARALETAYYTSADPDVGVRLGSHNEEEGRITFYFATNTPAKLAEIRGALDATGVRYRLVVEEPDARHSNIQILDIDL